MAKTLWVSPEGSNWKVHYEKEATLRTFTLKTEAIKYARQLVRNQAEGAVLSIRIQGADGRIQSEWTYGKDPFPPAG